MTALVSAAAMPTELSRVSVRSKYGPAFTARSVSRPRYRRPIFLWPVDTVIAKERLSIWCSRIRPTRAKLRAILPLLETPKRVILPVTTPGIGWGLAKEK